ncbi:MAG: hypothetical protein AB1898_20420 [Acidobacteriota bacterium]
MSGRVDEERTRAVGTLERRFRGACLPNWVGVRLQVAHWAAEASIGWLDALALVIRCVALNPTGAMMFFRLTLVEA